MARLGTRGEVVLFGCLVLALALGCATISWLEPLRGFTPLLAAVVLVLLTGRVGPAGWMSLGLGTLGWRLWPAAVLIPVVALGAGMLAVWQAGWTGLQIPGNFSLPYWLLLAAAEIVLLSVLSLGEEIGWRGWLLPRLAVYGRARAGLAVGLLWAAWHIPGHPFDPMFLVSVVLLGFAVNEVAMASRSVWPAAIFHGTHNALVGVLGGLTVNVTHDLSPLAGTTGVVTVGVYAVVALGICVLGRHWMTGPSSARDPFTINSLPRPTIAR